MQELESYQLFYQKLIMKNPGEVEFHQAVDELVSDIWPYWFKQAEESRDQLIARLCEPDRVISFRVSWEDDQGNLQTNRGYRVQFNNALGPYKGGLRFHPSVNLSILKFLAFEQTFKNALTTLPLGGAKGGSDFDPKGKSDREVMRFCQSFMIELIRYIGPDRDVPAGDIGVGAREISYLYGQYKRLSAQSSGVLTGKDIAFGGSHIRPEATGYGCVYLAEEILKKKGMSLEGKTCLISGSGNVAQYAAEKLIELGAKVLSFSDSSGSVYNPKGFNKEELAYLKELKSVKRGRISELAKEFSYEFYQDKKVWQFPAELAFPCATQNEILEEDARELLKSSCLLVAEGANMPVAKKALQLLRDAKVLIAPGKAANAGGVAISGLEMSQNSMRMTWERKVVDQKLQEIMKNIHQQCYLEGLASDGFVDYVKGANLASFKKVLRVVKSFGII